MDVWNKILRIFRPGRSSSPQPNPLEEPSSSPQTNLLEESSSSSQADVLEKPSSFSQIDVLEEPSSFSQVDLLEEPSPSPQTNLLEQLTPSHLGRLAIPTEIILTITKHLDKPSLLCFALTCQTLHCYCFPSSLDLSSSEKGEFLLLLEKDAANYYFCHFCVKLHPWHASWFEDRYSISRNFYPQSANHCKMKNWFNHFSISLPYPLARVVMNRHFYSAAHGVSANKLVDRGDLTHPCGNVTCSRAWDARIIDDQLMLSSVLDLGPLRDFEGLLSSINVGFASICKHLTTKVLFFRHQIPELVMRGSQPDSFARCHQSANSCPICMTDYCIDINRQGNGWAIAITTYHLLGGARSPWDWTWIAMANYPDKAVEVPRFKQPSGNQPGIVRHMWSKLDGAVFEPKGEWVMLKKEYLQIYGWC